MFRSLAIAIYNVWFLILRCILGTLFVELCAFSCNLLAIAVVVDREIYMQL